MWTSSLGNVGWEATARGGDCHHRFGQERYLVNKAVALEIGVLACDNKVLQVFLLPAKVRMCVCVREYMNCGLGQAK